MIAAITLVLVAVGASAAIGALIILDDVRAQLEAVQLVAESMSSRLVALDNDIALSNDLATLRDTLKETA